MLHKNETMLLIWNKKKSTTAKTRLQKKGYLANQKIMGNPKNNLFTSKTNFKVKRSISCYLDQMALGTDVFAIPLRDKKLNKLFQNSFLS